MMFRLFGFECMLASLSLVGWCFEVVCDSVGGLREGGCVGDCGFCIGGSRFWV